MGIARPCGITIIKDKLLEDRILNLKISRKYKAFTGVVKCTYYEANASLPDIFRTAAGMAGWITWNSARMRRHKSSGNTKKNVVFEIGIYVETKDQKI